MAKHQGEVVVVAAAVDTSRIKHHNILGKLVNSAPQSKNAISTFQITLTGRVLSFALENS